MRTRANRVPSVSDGSKIQIPDPRTSAIQLHQPVTEHAPCECQRLRFRHVHARSVPPLSTCTTDRPEVLAEKVDPGCSDSMQQPFGISFSLKAGFRNGNVLCLSPSTSF